LSVRVSVVQAVAELTRMYRMLASSVGAGQ
jgi:hypothetical protein